MKLFDDVRLGLHVLGNAADAKAGKAAQLHREFQMRMSASGSRQNALRQQDALS